jgi:hypothetical protein
MKETTIKKFSEGDSIPEGAKFLHSERQSFSYGYNGRQSASRLVFFYEITIQK